MTAVGARARSAPGVDAGLIVLRASRLEALLDPLRALLASTRPDSVLAPQTVVAAHPGMRQWLLAALAEREGPAGVVANLDVLLPGAWFERVAVAMLGQPALALPRYQRPHLRWALFALLDEPSPTAGLDADLLAAFLGRVANPGERERRQFQLADRLAGLYSQYLVYRPDWLQAWEAGRSALPDSLEASWHRLESGLLAPLWRRLVADLGVHRAALLRRLHAALSVADATRPALHVFGLSHLAPTELSLLRAFARSAPVLLYVADPCREYWGGLLAGNDDAAWRAWRAAETARLDLPVDEPGWAAQTHPLLARWGRLGQHFFSALAEGEVREDIRHREDEDTDAPGTRLARLQESVRRLDPTLMHEDADSAAARNDASLRVHACHTRLRELEVLRDALLDAIEQEGVRAADIVVMAPDIGRYAALIPAVFGEPGSRRERWLPYHLSDAPLRRNHHLFVWVQRLLALVDERIGAPLVADLLDAPEVRQALRIDPDAAATLIEWLRQSRVAWALDAADRARFGVPPVSEHSFAWALDRLLAGYVLGDPDSGDADACALLPDGTELLPITGVQGADAAALGALDRLLQALQGWRSLADLRLRAEEWAQRLRALIEALFAVPRDDEAGREALSELRQALAGLAQETAAVAVDPQLPFAVVREWLEARLAQVPERQPFLLGGVTFCGMVPQRAIPFAVIAVLGLDEGEFPRRRHPAGLDPMPQVRRLGDRDARSDDRYLFLETLMSARRRLHLSYIGEGADDGKPRNPAAPLAELLAALDDAAGLPADDARTPRPWLLRHRLQPFAASYFDGSDARLYSYRQAYAAMHGDGRRPVPVFCPDIARRPHPESRDPDSASPQINSPLPRFGGAGLGERGQLAAHALASPAADSAMRDVALDALRRFFRDPARELLVDRLRLRLDALDDQRLSEVEPLDARSEAIDALARRQFFARLDEAFVDSSAPMPMPAALRLGGVLAPGRLGERAWAREAEAIAALQAQLRDRGWLDRDAAARAGTQAVQATIALPGSGHACRVHGQIEHVYPLPAEVEGWQLLRAYPTTRGKLPGLKSEADLHFGERIPMFLDWALLRLCTAHEQPVRLHPLLAGPCPWSDAWCAWDADFVATTSARRTHLRDELLARVGELVRFYDAAAIRPPCYFPRSSWAAHRGRDIDEVWVGGKQRKGERDYEPGYNRLLAGDLRFAVDAAARAALHATATCLDAWLWPGEPGAGR